MAEASTPEAKLYDQGGKPLSSESNLPKESPVFDIKGNRVGEAVSDAKAREAFLARRSFIEGELRRSTPVRRVETPEGGKIDLISRVIEIPENLQSPDKQGEKGSKEVLVFIPGLSKINRGKLDMGSAPEINMAGLIDGGTDAVIYVKPEGLTSNVFTAVEGHPQQRTSEAIIQVLMEYVAEEEAKPDYDGVVFKIAGFSEGSTMAFSAAARILEEIKKNGNEHRLGIREVDAVGGGGIVGPDNVKEQGLRSFLGHLRRTLGGQKKAEQVIRQEILTTVGEAKKAEAEKPEGKRSLYIQNLPSGEENALKVPMIELEKGVRYVSGELLGVKGKRAFEDGYEGFVGNREQNFSEADFYREFLPIAADIIFGGERPLSEIKGPGPRRERLMAVICQNPDVDVVAGEGIPTVVPLASHDIFFPLQTIREGIATVREKYKDWPIQTLITNIEHKHFHQGAQGLAGIIKAVADSRPDFRKVVGWDSSKVN